MKQYLQRIGNDRIASLITSRLIRKKPLFLLRVIKRLLYEKTSKKQTLWSVLFATHYKCVLNCKHCYEKSFLRTNEKPMTTDEKKKVLKSCVKYGILTYDFIGGETFLDKDFPELIKSCSPWKSHIAVSTNGFILDEDKIKYYQELGVDKLNISVDSWLEEEHDTNRGMKGAHKKAFQAIDICKKIDMNLSINYVIYNGTTRTESFKKMVEYAVVNRIKLTFIAAVPLGRCENKNDILITEDDKKTMKYWHNEYSFLARNCIDKCGFCPAFRRLFAISAYGDVMPCDFIHISYGNLKKESLEVILKRAIRTELFGEKYNGCIPAEDKGFIDKYLPRMYVADPYPIKIEEIFSYREKNIQQCAR